MSTDNVERLRPVLAEWERGNFAAGADLLASSVVLSAFIPDGTVVCRGREEVERFVAEFFAQWRDYRIKVDALAAVDNATVLLEGRQVGIGTGSGIAIEESLAIVFKFDHDQVAGMYWHPQREQALTAAGHTPMDRIAAVREVFSEWAKGNFRAGAGLLAPERVAMWGEPPAGDVTCHGQRQIAERFGEFLATWSDFRVEADEFIPLHDDYVLVVARQYGKGKHSSVEIDARVHIVWKFAGEKVVGTYWFFDRAKALRVAGLSEEL